MALPGPTSVLFKALRVLRVLLAPKVLRALKALKVLLDLLGHKVLRALLVLMVLKVP